MRSPPAHAHAGLVPVVEGLVHPVVEEQEIHSGDEGPVGRMFQEGGILRVVAHFRPASKGLGPDDVLPVFLGFVHDGLVDTAVPGGPEFAHGHIRHIDGLRGTEGSPIGFPEELEAFFVDPVPGHLPAFPEETALDEEIPVLPEGIVPGIARIGFHQGDPGQRIIAADAGEILPEARRPVLVPCLVAVDQDMCEGLPEILSEVFLQRSQHLVPVILGHVPVHLVRLQGLADEFVRERMRVGQRGRMPDLENGPTPLRCIPDQIPVGIHPVREVDHLVRGSIGLGGNGHDGDVAVEGGLTAGTAPAPIHCGFRLGKDGPDGRAALDGRPAVHHLLHALFLIDPRSAGRTVSRRIVQADLQSQFLRNLGRISQGFPIGIAPIGPLRPGIVLHRMVRLLHRRGDVENRRSADSGLLHRLQILPDAFLGKVGAHPMPPDIGTVLHGRSSELSGQFFNLRHRAGGCGKGQ